MQLLRSERRTVGRLDSRYVGIDRTASGSQSEFDPANSAATPAFAACFNDYIRQQLKFETDDKYYILGGFPGFAWNYPKNAFGDTSEDLRLAMANNPHMKVLITSGYYDMATPYWATECEPPPLVGDASRWIRVCFARTAAAAVLTRRRRRHVRPHGHRAGAEAECRGRVLCGRPHDVFGGE